MSNATPDEARLDALGYVEQTIYANEDNPEPSTWSNADVLELLQEVAERLMLDGEIIAPECGATIDSLVDVGHTHVCCAPQDHGDAHACECGAWFELVPVSPNSGSEP